MPRLVVNRDVNCIANFNETSPLPNNYYSWIVALTRECIVAGLGLACLVLVLWNASDTLRNGLVALYIVFLAAVLGGRGIARLAATVALPLPPLLGMLVGGLVSRNVPTFKDVAGDRIDANMSAILRTAALVLILCRAGLGLDLASLCRLRWAVLRLAALPCLVEATTIALLAATLLHFPAAWAALLGFTVAAVSPAVVVPSLLALQEQGYGVTTGIPTLVVAAAALDDVLSLAGFGICLGLALPTAAKGGLLGGAITGPEEDFLRAPVELILGLACGLLGASILVWLAPAPSVGAGKHLHNSPRSEGSQHHLRLLLLCATAIAFGLKALGLSGASALATLTLAAAAAHKWRQVEPPDSGDSHNSISGATPAPPPPPSVVADVGSGLGTLWTRLAQPLLFGLLGAAVDLSTLTPSVLGTGLLMLCVSCSVRLGVTAMAVSGRGLRKQELLFVAMAWLPKATVQAAIGAVALDYARTDEEVLFLWIFLKYCINVASLKQIVGEMLLSDSDMIICQC